jgi:cysteine desulfurase
MIYLDNNATTFIDPVVKAWILEFLEEEWGNPSSTHRYGQKSKGLLSRSRKTIAQFLKCAPEQIIFTSGGTEGAFLAIHGLLGKKRGRIITSNVEHACVLATLQSLEQKGVEVVYLPAGEQGAIQPEGLRQALAQKPSDLVVLIGANNETGVLNEIEKIAEITEEASVPLKG